MVLPTTAHAAFHKAAHYLGVEPVLVDVDPETKRADPDAMAAAIDDDTVLVVASAPSYAHGVIDPVGPIAAAAAAARGPLPRRRLHRRLGAAPPATRRAGPGPWTFAVEGVTSISLDLHKYAYTPKGVSILLHRSAALRRDPPLRLGPVARLHDAQHDDAVDEVRWAARRRVGRRQPHRRATATRRLARRARAGDARARRRGGRHPSLSVAAAAGLDAARADGRRDVRRLHHRRRDARARVVRPAADVASATSRRRCTSPSAPPRPTPSRASRRTSPRPPRRPSLSVRRRRPRSSSSTASSVDPEHLDEDTFAGLLAVAGLADDSGALALPERMAPINALLDALPPELREALLLGVIDRLTRPTPSGRPV